MYCMVTSIIIIIRLTDRTRRFVYRVQKQFCKSTERVDIHFSFEFGFFVYSDFEFGAEYVQVGHEKN
jgi:hypothetical protein